jgi:hypothetical protein
MSDPNVFQAAPADATQAELMSALFAQMVLQQSNLALMLMGKTPHPESGQKMRDMEGAKLFIDQLEMLEAKTKGNLSKEESDLLKQSLMALRMAFVECVNSAPPAEARAQAGAAATGPASTPDAAQATTTPGPSGGAEESHKKFTKKY